MGPLPLILHTLPTVTSLPLMLVTLAMPPPTSVMLVCMPLLLPLLPLRSSPLRLSPPRLRSLPLLSTTPPMWAPAVHAVHAVAPAVATVPVVQYGLQHTVQHVPQVHVQKHVSTHTTHHVINHAPVVGAYVHGLPVATTAVVADAPAAAEAAPVEEA